MSLMKKNNVIAIVGLYSRKLTSLLSLLISALAFIQGLGLAHFSLGVTIITNELYYSYCLLTSVLMLGTLQFIL